MNLLEMNSVTEITYMLKLANFRLWRHIQGLQI